MKYMRKKAGFTWADDKTNTQIAKELKITPILYKLLEYKRNWIEQVNCDIREYPTLLICYNMVREYRTSKFI